MGLGGHGSQAQACSGIAGALQLPLRPVRERSPRISLVITGKALELATAPPASAQLGVGMVAGLSAGNPWGWFLPLTACPWAVGSPRPPPRTCTALACLPSWAGPAMMLLKPAPGLGHVLEFSREVQPTGDTHTHTHTCTHARTYAKTERNLYWCSSWQVRGQQGRMAGWRPRGKLVLCS